MLRLKSFPQQLINISFAVIFCALCLATARAQQTGDETVRIESNLVRLNVGVVDRQGHPVTTLSRDDFVVYEDGVRQPIVSFEPTQAPFSLVLLLDMSGSTLPFRTTLKQSALRFLDALAPDDRVALMTFNEKTELLTHFTTDRRKTAYAIAELAKGAGKTNFYNALRESLKLLALEGARRKAIVVLTDGVDTLQRDEDRAAALRALNANEDAVKAITPDASAALRSVLDAADRQGVTIYPLALPSGDPRHIPDPLPQQVAIYTAARARLETLANRTGGRLHEINRLEDMGRMYAEVAAEMRTLYSIAYNPNANAQAKPRADGWRTINIELRQPELIARTRPGYYTH
jgi:VWFA-related protein